jgi:hypothetical protein
VFFSKINKGTLFEGWTVPAMLSGSLAALAGLTAKQGKVFLYNFHKLLHLTHNFFIGRKYLFQGMIFSTFKIHTRPKISRSCPEFSVDQNSV